MTMLVVVIAQAATALALAQVREMPPSAAGNAILGKLPHGQIESFDAPTGGMLPPGMIEGRFVEKPNLFGSVCVRKVWTVLFRAAPNADIGTAKPETAHGNQEIAIPVTRSCPSGQYVYLNPGIRVDQGEAILNMLKGASAPHSQNHFACSDETSSGLCAGDKAVRSSLRTMKPWLITDNGTAVLLGSPGGVVTEVSFEPVNSSRVRVRRFIPAPF